MFLKYIKYNLLNDGWVKKFQNSMESKKKKIFANN